MKYKAELSYLLHSIENVTYRVHLKQQIMCNFFCAKENENEADKRNADDDDEEEEGEPQQRQRVKSHQIEQLFSIISHESHTNHSKR